MRFLPPDDDVELYENTFEDDVLGRSSASKALSELIERIDDPLVIALDGKWGSGKTFFLKRWVGAHRKSNNGTALTIYFDAFASDYLSDPLIALLAAVSNRMPKDDEPKLRRVQQLALKLLRPASRVGLALASSGGTEIAGAFWDAGIKAVSDEAKVALDKFWEKELGRQSAMQEFRQAIEALTSPADGGKPVPIVIVVDELDRCRPDYALEILEVMKHFFAVRSVHFILGVNMESLENSVRARYGTNIDATKYLQKFISISTTLPNHIGDHPKTPSILKYATHIGETMGIPKKFLGELLDQISLLSRTNGISIRDVGRIMSTATLLPDVAVDENNFAAWEIATATLLITRVVRPDFFEKLAFGIASDSDLEAYFGADSDKVSEKLSNGEYNPKYQHSLMVKFYCWKYICRDGVSDGSDLWSQLGGLFGRFGGMRSPRSIPEGIVEDWLNLFKLTSAQ